VARFVSKGSIALIEIPEPNFRKRPEAEIQTEALPDFAGFGVWCTKPGVNSYRRIVLPAFEAE
jgi:hypothetical protein